MLARWYSIFLGMLLLVLGVAVMAVPDVIGAHTGALVSTGIVWLITAMMALWFGFAVRSQPSLRWFAGIAGACYLVWGIIALVTAGTVDSLVWTALSLVMLLLGTLGVAAALTPAFWLREGEATPAPQ